MTKHNNQAAQHLAPTTPITQEAVQRLQRHTAATNGGKQAGWTRRLQSAADKRTAFAHPVGGAMKATSVQRMDASTRSATPIPGEMMKRQNNQAGQRPAPTTPITQEVVQRLQRRTAAPNDGKQADWTRRPQSAADKRSTQAASAAKPVAISGGAAGRHSKKGPSGKKMA